MRVWDFVVEPGKSKGWHRHELPYVIIPMTDGDIELEIRTDRRDRAAQREDRRTDLAGRRRGPRSSQRGKCDVSKHLGRDQTAITLVRPESQTNGISVSGWRSSWRNLENDTSARDCICLEASMRLSRFGQSHSRADLRA